jgi:DNA modification methylase
MSYPLGRAQLEQLEVTLVDPASLVPDKRNARTHPKSQIEQIVRNVGQKGWTNPILTDEGLTIIAGHGRLLAAKQLGMAAVPIIILRGLTETQKRAVRIADNKIALNAGWDLELLKLELAEIVLEDAELELGFEPGELEHLLATPVDPDEEAIPAVPQVAVSQDGDLWILRQHRFAVGDCADPALMQQLMKGETADAAFLDVPYNQAPENIGNKGKIKHRPIAGAAGELSPGEFKAKLALWLGSCAVVTRDGGVHFVCMDHQHAEELLAAGRQTYGARLNICIWRKSNAGMGALYRSQHEMIYVYRVGSKPHLNAVQLGKHGRNRTNIWDAPSVNTFGGSRAQDLALHPTVKPVQLVADAIMDVTRRGEIVLDAFLGSGTTLIACERTGRICRGIEIDPVYADVILERFMTLTGIEAMLEATGESFAQVRARRATDHREG